MPSRSQPILLAALCILAAPPIAYAVEVIGNFEAVVTNTFVSDDGRVPIYGRSVPVGIVVGDRLRGTIRYDTNRAIEDERDPRTYSSYSFPNGGASFRIEGNGYTWTAGPQLSDFTSAVAIDVQDNYFVGNTYQSRFLVTGASDNFVGNVGANNVGRLEFAIQRIFESTPGSLVSGTSLPQRNDFFDLAEGNYFGASIASDVYSGGTIVPGRWGVLSRLDLSTLEICPVPDLVCQSKALRWANYYRGLLTRAGMYAAGFKGTWITCVSAWTCVPLYAAAGLSIYEAKLLFDIINDPPDTNYWEIALPEEIQPIVLVPPVPEAIEPYALANAYFEAYSEYLSVLVAWRVTLERYQGAMADGAIEQADIQEEALARYINKATNLTSSLSALGVNFANSMESLNGGVQVPHEAFETSIQSLSISDLDPAVMDHLSSFGMTVDDIDLTLSQIREANYDRGPYDLFGQIRSAADDVSELSGRYACLTNSCNIKSINIDVRPLSRRNHIAPNSRGFTFVSVLSGSDFDATELNVQAIKLGANEAEAKRHWSKDVNRDGLVDLLLGFKTRDIGILCGDSEVTLTGETFDFREVSGVDSITTVGCRWRRH